ncbi:S41 family peptidase [Aquimarina gracilis]|uniref:S41 family peptidase n=1 Tax=Aquimarina gracilis TaxID=874422 RepID=A0ABU5ZVV3_9FLAO|nr:S41 family peptidase [Aquimarina gracilis]MEB3346016.1 S41 family peptidase [Aquimarina gracilis]
MRFVILAFLCGLTSLYAQEKLSKKQLEKDLDILKINLQTYHTGLYTYTPREELNNWFEATKQKLTDSMTSYEFFRKLGKLNSIIKNGHTFVHINPAQREKDLKMPAFSIFKCKNSFYIKESSLKEYKNLVGKKITSINGDDMAHVFSKLLQYMTRDGNNMTMPKEQLLHSFSFMYALIYGSKDSTAITIKDELKTIDIKIPNVTASILESKAEKLYETGKIEFRTKDSIAFLSIPTFNAIPLKRDQYKSKLKNAFKRIQNKGIEHLVIDIRDNGGGNTPMVEELISYVYNKEFQFYEGIYQLHNKWNKDIIPEISDYPAMRMGWTYLKKEKNGLYKTTAGDGLNVVKPKKTVYNGKLYVLLNGNSLSAAGEFASFIKQYRNAIFIGEESGGNKVQNTSGDWLKIALPNSKLVIAIPYILWKMNVNFKNDGHGIKPNYLITNTITDELNNYDRAMDFTINHIRKSTISKKTE